MAAAGLGRSNVPKRALPRLTYPELLQRSNLQKGGDALHWSEVVGPIPGAEPLNGGLGALRDFFGTPVSMTQDGSEPSAADTPSAEYAMGQPNALQSYYADLIDTNPNVRAGLAVIKAMEGTAKAKDPYSTGFGFNPIADLSWHPNVARSFGNGQKTTAAGAYQFLTRTWNKVANSLGLKDFGPRSQDIAALALIDGRGGLQALMKGDFKTFEKKVAREWASFPSAPYDQPKKTEQQFEQAWNLALADAKGVPTPTQRPVSPAEAAPYQEAAAGLGAAGVRGIGGNPDGIFAAPVSPVQRAPLPAVAGTMASPLAAAPVSPVTRSPLAPPPGMATSLPSPQLAAIRPDGRLPFNAIPPGQKEAYQQLASTMGTAWVDGIDGRMAPADPIWSGVQPKTPAVKQPARPITRTPASAMPFKPGAVKTFPKAPTVPLTTRSIPQAGTEPIRKESVSGGKAANTGLSAMSAVISGRTNPGSVAFSASNPGFSTISLPGGKYARSSSKYGWSEVIADDDVLGIHYGKVIAVDPTGKSYKAVTPAEAKSLAAKGWSVSNMPGKGISMAPPAYGPGIFGLFSGSKGTAGKSSGPSLGGFLSGLFGSRGLAPGKSIGQQAVGQAMGLAAGLFGPAGGMGGIGLGGPAGPAGVGGLGAPGFGGQISSNPNYYGCQQYRCRRHQYPGLSSGLQWRRCAP